MTQHANLPDSGHVAHHILDKIASKLERTADQVPKEVTGARDDPEAALANLLAALEELGLLKDNTTAS